MWNSIDNICKYVILYIPFSQSHVRGMFTPTDKECHTGQPVYMFMANYSKTLICPELIRKSDGTVQCNKLASSMQLKPVTPLEVYYIITPELEAGLL
jgi:hypothetical protein